MLYLWRRYSFSLRIWSCFDCWAIFRYILIYFCFWFDCINFVYLNLQNYYTCEFQLTFWIYLKTIVWGNFFTLTHFVLCTWKWCKICILRFFLSIIRHSLVIWDNSSKISNVFILQKRAVRVMSKAGSLDHCKPLFIPTNCYKFIYFWFNSLYTQKFGIYGSKKCLPQTQYTK